MTSLNHGACGAEGFLQTWGGGFGPVSPALASGVEVTALAESQPGANQTGKVTVAKETKSVMRRRESISSVEPVFVALSSDDI